MNKVADREKERQTERVRLVGALVFKAVLFMQCISKLV